VPESTLHLACPDDQFAARVLELSGVDLLELLLEDHSIYQGRNAFEVARMRAWLYQVIADRGYSLDAMIYLLEELETGVDPYPMAAAAWAIRKSEPHSYLAPSLVRGIKNVRFHDTAVTLGTYGEYDPGRDSTSALRELLETLKWLGAAAGGVSDEIRELASQDHGLPSRYRPILKQILDAILVAAPTPSDECCRLPESVRNLLSGRRADSQTNSSLSELECQDEVGRKFAYQDFFGTKPCVVVFFYTRCDNPQKCSLTVSKLGQLQRMLQDRSLADQVRTAAISYDPDYDLPARLRVYARDRNLILNENHRMIRTPSGIDRLAKQFGLNVGFDDSLVNRHSIEVFVLDRNGRVSQSFRRLHWEPDVVYDVVAEMVGTAHSPTNTPAMETISGSGTQAAIRSGLPSLLTTASAIAFAFFPKCPICWAAYLSMFGVVGIEQVPYFPWIGSVLLVLAIVGVLSIGWRSWATRRIAPLGVAVAGIALLIGHHQFQLPGLRLLGIAATMIGTAWCTLPRQRTAE